MKIHIKDGSYALLHTPTKLTYAIRISSDIGKLPDLRKSEFYRVIKKYEFGDVTPEDLAGDSYGCQEKLLDEDIAKQIIMDFSSGRERCLELFVHCFAGRGRSPAVAIALNEIFDLGNDFSEAGLAYPDLNRFVYKTLIRVAGDMNFDKK